MRPMIAWLPVFAGIERVTTAALLQCRASQICSPRSLEVGEQVVTDNMLLLARQFRLAQDEAKDVAKDGVKNTTTAEAKR